MRSSPCAQSSCNVISVTQWQVPTLIDWSNEYKAVKNGEISANMTRQTFVTGVPDVSLVLGGRCVVTTILHRIQI